MINYESLNASVPTAIKAAQKGKTVVAVNGTPLAQLVSSMNACMLGGSYVRAVNESEELLPENLDGSYMAHAVNQGENGTPHDNVMDSYVEDISKAVLSHISFAKNVVSPMAVTMIENVTKAMAYDPKSAALKFSVEVNDLPEPMTNGAFEQGLAKFKEKTFLYPEKRLSLGARTSEEVFALLQTGSKDFDEKLGVWYATLSPAFVANVWETFFGKSTAPDDGTVAYASQQASWRLTTNQGDRGSDNFAVLTYLVADKLSQDIPKDTGMSLKEFEDVLYYIKEAAAVATLSIYDRLTLSIKSKLLVETIAFDRKSARVNGTVYREWLKAGGTNEIVLGMLVSGNNYRTVADFEDHADKLKQAWYQHEELSATVARNNSYNRFVNAIESAFSALSFNEPSEQEKALWEEKPNLKEDMARYFKEELENVRTSDLDNVNETCLRILCRSRYFYTDAEKFLSSINAATKANPLIDVRTAALIATIEYVADYVADQMALV